jgi:predicted MFS family arabinose efflux permease
MSDAQEAHRFDGTDDFLPPRKNHRRVSLWRNRSFTILWTAQVISTVGTRISSIAYPLLVLALYGSPARAGLVGFSQTLPFAIFFLPAGALTDRWNRKRVMLASDGIRALALGSIAIALTLGRLTLIQILIAAFVEGTFYVFFQLAEWAALPHIVTREQLPVALAQNQAREQGADLAGQPLGGILFGIAHALPFLADAVSYVVSFVSLLFIRPAFQAEHVQDRRSLRADVMEGIRWLWRERFLRATVGLVGITNFAMQALVLILIVRARHLGASPGLIGAMLAFFGAGAIVGAFIAPWVQRHIASRVVVVGCLWLWAAEMGVLSVMPNAISLGAVVGIVAINGPCVNVVVGTYRYQMVPDWLQARITSVARLVAWGPIPLGSLAAGLLLERFGSISSFLVLAGLVLAAAVVASLSPAIRRAPSLAASPTS